MEVFENRFLIFPTSIYPCNVMSAIYSSNYCNNRLIIGWFTLMQKLCIIYDYATIGVRHIAVGGPLIHLIDLMAAVIVVLVLYINRFVPVSRRFRRRR